MTSARAWVAASSGVRGTSRADRPPWAGHDRRASTLGGVEDAQDRPRDRLEPFVADRLAALVARSVGPVVQLEQRALDVVELGVEALGRRHLRDPLHRL